MLDRRIDVAQLLVHTSNCVGSKCAQASAKRVVGEEALRVVAPLVQSAILTSDVRGAVRRSDLLTELRTGIVADSTSSEFRLMKIQRFSACTVIMPLALMIALVVVGTMNFTEVAKAIGQANPWWILEAIGALALTWGGGAIPRVALTAERIRPRSCIAW